MGRTWLFRVSMAVNFLLLMAYVIIYYFFSPPKILVKRSAKLLLPNIIVPLNIHKSVTTTSDPFILQAVLKNINKTSREDITKNNKIVIADHNREKNQIIDSGDDKNNYRSNEDISADLYALENAPIIKQLIRDDNEVVKALDTSSNKLFPCDDLSVRTHYAQRGSSYWVLYNYIQRSKVFRCDQSITYTTHSDFTFLDNLIPLLERWQGPLSLSIYAPGMDFDETMTRILYLRECSSSTLVKDFVTFHLFFDNKHIPKIIKNPESIPINCSVINAPIFGASIITYKKFKGLSYPVNVARNIARDMATTHYILPSDIELYPSPNLIPDFLQMVKNNDSNMQRPSLKVFVLSIFEVEKNIRRLPNDRRDLQSMLKNKSAIPFHKYVCTDCHRIPKAKEWINAPFQSGLKVFHVKKRYKPYHHWEPIYIGTKFDPMYDERLSWEGRSDKMTQGYVLCLLDYEFHILDNAFLVHRPGVKRKVVRPEKYPVVTKQSHLIASVIVPELKFIYGSRPGCVVH